MATFIGGTNILRGRRSTERVSIIGRPLRTLGRRAARRRGDAVSVRQHNIKLATAAPSDMDNCLSGIVLRQVFLGTSRDYPIRLEDKTELRVTAPAEQDIAPDLAVWAHLPAEHCRALMVTEEEEGHEHEADPTPVLAACGRRHGLVLRIRARRAAGSDQDRRALIAAAKKEGKVVWYTAVDLPIAEKIAKAFEAKYPRRHRCASSARAPSATSSASARNRRAASSPATW